MTTTLSRLSALNIEDDVLRAYLFSDVLAQAADESITDVTEYEICPDEQYRPDLVAFRVYGNADLRWVVSLVADVEDEADPLPVGSVLRLPYAAWLRERIRHYMDSGEL